MELQRAKQEEPEGSMSLQEEESVVTDISPLSIELILDHVLDYCGIESLKACTLVWKKEASSALRRNFWLTFPIIPIHYVVSYIRYRSPERKMKQLTSNSSNPEFQYKKLTLWGKQWKQAEFKDFLQAYGAQLNSLCIKTSLTRLSLNELQFTNSPKFHTLPKLLHAALSVWCPNLVELRIVLNINSYSTLYPLRTDSDEMFVAPLKLKLIQLKIVTCNKNTVHDDDDDDAAEYNKFVRPFVNFIASAIAASPDLKTIDTSGRLSMPNLRNFKLSGKDLMYKSYNTSYTPVKYDEVSDVLPTFSSVLTKVDIEVHVPEELTSFHGKTGGFALVSQFIAWLPKLEIFTLKVNGVRRTFAPDSDDYSMWNLGWPKSENLRSLCLVDRDIRGGNGGMLLIDDVKFLENIAISYKNLQHLEVDVLAKRTGWSHQGQLVPPFPLEMALKYLAGMPCLNKAILRIKLAGTTPMEKDTIVFSRSMLQQFRQDEELKQTADKMKITR